MKANSTERIERRAKRQGAIDAQREAMNKDLPQGGAEFVESIGEQITIENDCELLARLLSDVEASMSMWTSRYPDPILKTPRIGDAYTFAADSILVILERATFWLQQISRNDDFAKGPFAAVIRPTAVAIAKASNGLENIEGGMLSQLVASRNDAKDRKYWTDAFDKIHEETSDLLLDASNQFRGAAILYPGAVGPSNRIIRNSEAAFLTGINGGTISKASKPKGDKPAEIDSVGDAMSFDSFIKWAKEFRARNRDRDDEPRTNQKADIESRKVAAQRSKRRDLD